MKREQILARMGLRLPENTRLRVVVCSDVANEADDPFAVLHHLLTPNFDVRGVIAAHFESKAPGTRTTMEVSYQALLRLLRAAEIGAEVILLAKNVDGVYDSDPAKNPDAKKYEKLSYMDVLNQGLGVMDTTATSLSMDNHIPILVFALSDPENIYRAVNGEKIGTIVEED